MLYRLFHFARKRGGNQGYLRIPDFQEMYLQCGIEHFYLPGGLTHST
ncbi:hypothetical protein LEP1GSC179_1709 [Leptospira santarosai str. MOR084]|uniref:Uncharacterized protein n=1 Tax=Leptospira santarosai str. MOR084 TaxID=1049984 RepID=A0A0E2BC49_9LEPT|nr:hypothetical protein LEP1GSC179_1709 [Leptospira santarosai str. MOR084]